MRDPTICPPSDGGKPISYGESLAGAILTPPWEPPWTITMHESFFNIRTISPEPPTYKD